MAGRRFVTSDCAVGKELASLSFRTVSVQMPHHVQVYNCLSSHYSFSLEKYKSTWRCRFSQATTLCLVVTSVWMLPNTQGYRTLDPFSVSVIGTLWRHECQGGLGSRWRCHYIRKRLLLDSVLCQTNPIHTLTPCLCKTHFKVSFHVCVFL
jgi:hypothetical protein